MERGSSRAAWRTPPRHRLRSAAPPAHNMPGNPAFLGPSTARIATGSDRPGAPRRRPVSLYTSPMSAPGPIFQIAHISDLHCGGPYFLPSLMERAIGEINDLAPDLVICTGDLTTFG